jgi:fluoride exporter
VSRRSAILIALGGALGATVRWATFAALPTFHDFPVATFALNVAGSGILALVVVHSRTTFSGRPEVGDLVGVGFCGGLTTFSTFAVEIADLGRDGRVGLAATYALTSVAAAALTAWLVGRSELGVRGRAR